MLGAGPLRTYFEVTLPLTRPGVMAGAIFAFIVSFDQFPISLFLVVPGRRDAADHAVQLLKFDLDGAIARRLDGIDPAGRAGRRVGSIARSG